MRKYVVVAALCAVATLCLASGVRPSVTGMVVDTEGKPLAHATVTVYHAGVRTGYSTFCPSCYRDCGRRVKTDAAGSFALRDLAPDLWFTLLAVDDGYVPRISAKVDPEKSAGVRLVLASRGHAPGAGSVLRGRVTDTSGSPVEEAVVRPVGLLLGEGTGLAPAGASIYGTVDGLDPLAVTNGRGEFELAYAKASPRMLIEVEGRGFAPKFAALDTGAERQTVVVSEGAVLRGTLTANGRPVPNAEVGLIAKNRGGYRGQLTIVGDPYEEQHVGTGPDGSFLLSNVPEPVTWLLYGKMSSMPQGEATPPMEISTSAERQFVDGVQLVARPAHRVSGKVLLSDGRPVPDGMRIFLSSASAWDSLETGLKPNGSFEFRSVPTGDFCLTPAVRGYEARRREKSTCDGPVKVEGDVVNVAVTVYPTAARP